MSTNSSQPWGNQLGDSQIERLRASVRRAWTTPPRLSVPDWADKYRKLAKEAGSTSGNWHTSTVEIARGPMLAVTEPGVHVITVMCCTQLLKTALLENIFGFFAHTDPCPILLLQPKEDAAEQFSKERISPMLRVTPVLRDLVGTGRMKSSDETLLFKAFPGGFMALAGAGSPDNLARRPIRVLLADEVDKYPVTREGDPIALAEERTATFGLNWLSVRVCSPTVEDESRIAASYADSDQRRASLECPHCAHRLFPEFFQHVQWEKSESGEHLTKTARVFCEVCGVGWSEGERLRALASARWHQTRPFEHCGRRQVPLDTYGNAWRATEDTSASVAAVWDWHEDAVDGRYAVFRAKCGDCGAWPVDNVHAGFQASKMFSPWQKDRPADIAAKWIKAKGDADKEQAWWNTQAALPHRPHSGKHVALEALAARGEVWPAEMPDGPAVLTAGVDVQDYRVEIEIVGWGVNEESWSIEHHVIEGEFSEPETQTKLDAYLRRIWRRSDGRGFETVAACVDSGGHHTQAVYAFAKARLGRHVWAIKGESARTGQRNPVWPTKRPSSRNKQAFRPIILGVNAAKDTIRQRLHLDKPGPGYMHFPADRDINYYAQLTAERSVVKVASGVRYRVWELPAGRANEATDCRVYAYAALCGLMHFGLQLNRRAATAAKPPVVEDYIALPVIVPQAAQMMAVKAAPPKRSFITRLA